jgi:2-dehydro-3-deoxygluconokinase
MNRFVSFGEVLLRLSAAPPTRLTQAAAFDVVYGGSEANVAAALAQWGVSAAHVTVLPQNELGEAALRSLRQHGIDTTHVRFSDGRLGIYFLEHGAHVRSPKVVYDRFHSAFAALEPDNFSWPDILIGASWFHWSGITPAVSAGAAAACKIAVETARRKGLTISADINYRRVLWQYGCKPAGIMPGLMEHSDILIGGATDFENCLGKKIDPALSIEQLGEKLKPLLPRLSWLANTKRVAHHTNHQELQGELWDGRQTWRSHNHVIQPVIDRVGSGDAFAAGLAYARMNHYDAQRAINLATAAAVWKHSMHGDVLCASLTEIEALANGGQTGKLLR